MIQKVKSTEKIVRMIESENTIVFEADLKSRKPELKTEIEKLFGVKVESINTQSRGNKKIVYVKLKPAYQAADIASKLGVI
jgi:large subunit ribosomal protein L23